MFDRLRSLWRFLDRIGWLIAIVFLAIGFHVLHEQGQSLHMAQQTLATTQTELATTQTELTSTQNALVRSQKESTKTRIVTVTQRCDLTAKILHVLVRQDPSVAGSFQVSYRGCERQLAEVKAINAHAP